MNLSVIEEADQIAKPRPVGRMYIKESIFEGVVESSTKILTGEYSNHDSYSR